MTIAQLKKNVQEIVNNIGTLVIDSAMDNQKFIVESNKKQLWDGKTINGNDIRPFYSEDPYFKSKKQAIAYRNWKWAITPNPNRNKDAPNLYINGTLVYDNIYAKATDKEIEVTSKVPEGKKVFDKFKDTAGLNEEHKGGLAKLSLPNLLKKLKNELQRS